MRAFLAALCVAANIYTAQAVTATANIFRPISLGCVLQGGQTCTEDGYSCLVMFPESEWQIRKKEGNPLFHLFGDAVLIGGSRPRLSYEFKEKPLQAPQPLRIEKDLALDPEIAREFGYASITLRRGYYPVEVHRGSFGGFTFDVGLGEATGSLQGEVRHETAPGLDRAIITTPRGNAVYVNFPSDLAPGETFSGSVIAEPAGATAAERAHNFKELEGQVIEVASQRIPATGGTFTVQLPESGWIGGGDRCIIVYQKGPVIIRSCDPVNQLVPNGDFLLPAFGVNGRSLAISGKFDGLFSPGDSVHIGSVAALPLTQSLRQTVVFNTLTTTGPTEIEVREQGKNAKGAFRNLSIDLTANKNNLRKGQWAWLSLKVTGLESLEQSLPLRLENSSPEIVTLKKGNRQELTVRPKDVRGGVFEQKQKLTGLRPGPFHIQASANWAAPEGSAQKDWLRSALPLTPEKAYDFFGRLHNAGIEAFRDHVAKSPVKLTRENFPVEFHRAMTPFIRTVSQDPRFAALFSGMPPSEAVAQIEGLLDRFEKDPDLRRRLTYSDDPSAQPTQDPQEFELARRIRRDLDVPARLLDSGCLSYDQYLDQVGLLESRALLPGSDAYGDPTALQLLALARYSAALGQGEAALRPDFPWREVLGGDLNGASTGAWLGGFTGPGGAAAGGIMGGIFGSALVLYDHGYVKD